MGTYLLFLTAFLVIPISPPISILIVVGWLLSNWMEKKDSKAQSKKYREEDGIRKKEYKRHKLKLKTNSLYAKEKFFNTFCAFGNKDYVKNGVDFLKKHKDEIIIPTVWRESIEPASNYFYKPAYKGDERYLTVIECFDNYGIFLARHIELHMELDAPPTDDCVPQSHSIYKREDIITLQSGEKIEIIFESWHVAGGFSDGNLHINRNIYFNNSNLITKADKIKSSGVTSYSNITIEKQETNLDIKKDKDKLILLERQVESGYLSKENGAEHLTPLDIQIKKLQALIKQQEK